MKKLVIISDYGLDDAAATLSILRNSHLFSQIDILPIGGNVPVSLSFQNIQVLLSNFAGDISKVRIVDTSAIPQPEEHVSVIHGVDGLGDFLSRNISLSLPIISYSDWISELPNDVTILNLGPMTVLKQIFCDVGCREFIFMGGSVHGIPNYNGYEFNHGMDRLSFEYCVKFPHVGVSLDVACPFLDITERDLSKGDLYYTILERYRTLVLNAGEIGCYVWDDIAVQYFLHPEWFLEYDAMDKDGNKLNIVRYISDQSYLDG